MNVAVRDAARLGATMLLAVSFTWLDRSCSDFHQFSFLWRPSISSMVAMCLSVIVWISSSARRSSSSPIIFSFSRSLTSAHAHRDEYCGSATRPPSASWRTSADHVLATLLGKWRQRHADNRSRSRRVKPEIRGHDGLLDGLRPCSFPTAIPSACVESSTLTLATWFSGTVAPVVLDGNVVEQAGMRPACPHLGEVPVPASAAMLLSMRSAGVFLDLVEHHAIRLFFISCGLLGILSGRHQRTHVGVRPSRAPGNRARPY